MSRYSEPEPGEWIRPKPTGYKLACCDCGLVHRLDFRIEDGHVEVRFFPAKRETRQVRRHARLIEGSDPTSPEADEDEETPEQANAMWAYQFVGSLSTIYDFAEDDIVPLLDHLSAMAEGMVTGNEDAAAVPGSVVRWAASGAPVEALRASQPAKEPTVG